MTDLWPTLGAVIVAWRDDPRLATCVDALRAQRGVRLDVVMVENAASERAVPIGGDQTGRGGAVVRVRRVRRAANPGFAAAFDEGLTQVDSDWVLSVNPDCRLDPDCVRRAWDCGTTQDRVGAVAFRLRRAGGAHLDSAGIVVSPVLWRARDRGAGEPATGRFVTGDVVDAACLAGALLRRQALDQARDSAGEVLDRRYFAYQEDVDLGWRIRRAGWTIAFEPAAGGEHDRGWREGERRRIPVTLRRFSLQNRLHTILKNAPWTGLICRLPALLLFETALFGYLLLREPAVTLAYPAWVRSVFATIRRRRLYGTKG